jgi:hypothetical protein
MHLWISAVVLFFIMFVVSAERHRGTLAAEKTSLDDVQRQCFLGKRKQLFAGRITMSSFSNRCGRVITPRFLMI